MTEQVKPLHHWFTWSRQDTNGAPEYRLRSLCGAADMATGEVATHPEIFGVSPKSLTTAPADGEVQCEECGRIAAIERRVMGEVPEEPTKVRLFALLQLHFRYDSYRDGKPRALRTADGWRIRCCLIAGEGEVIYDVPEPVQFRAADVVRHRPSGEKWVLAYADMERGEVSACGWPRSIGKASDCDLVDAATDEQHEAMLRQWAEEVPKSLVGNDHDHRVGVCRRQLAALRASTGAAT